ncbi:MAG: protein-L-isoaspartate(D-aspartate) O-methyltransferase [Nitriliruptorales bacterium]|nr:protein-L-isoaspartate(D-aspartate) O-methyltransferase [Nitriliruptorales bacterium]
MSLRRDLHAAARDAGVSDPRLLEAIQRTPRREFVPPEYAEDADIDEPVPIPHQQVTSQPSLSARMIDALELRGDGQVLEVGTGYGYQTALLARLAKQVVSIERFGSLAEAARANLARHGTANVQVVTGDGTQGWPAAAPYDAILVSAAFPVVPPPLVEQLVEGGRLVQPIGSGGAEEVILFGRTADGLQRLRKVSPARFVRLTGRHGFAD